MRRLILIGLVLLLAVTTRVAAQDTQAFDHIYIGACTLRAASGSPEGAVVGTICDTYFRTDTGDRYLKTSGSGNTGWSLLPRVDALNVFTVQQELSSAAPLLYFTETDQGSNLKTWRTLVDGQIWNLQTTNDAKNSVLATLLSIDRSGNATLAGGLTATTGSFSSTLHAAGNFDVNTSKFTVNAGTGNAAIAGTLDQTGTATIHADLLPASEITSNLGSLQTKLLAVYASELWTQQLVASTVAATVGGRVLVAPTTTLTQDRSPQVAAPAAPTVTPQGTPGGTTYSYKITALDVDGETLPSSAGQTTTGNATLTVSNFNRVTWASVTGASTYRVYGRTSGSWLLMTTTAATTFDDTGTVTPSGAVPSANTTAAQIFVKSPIFRANDQPYMESSGRVESFLVNQWGIVAVSTGSKTFSVTSDFTSVFTAGRVVIVAGSTGNNGQYTVTGSASYNSGTNRTTFTVIEAIPSSTADGGITYVSTGANAFIYTTTRDRDGTGSNQWYAGDALVSTGTTGDGFIDLYSVSGVLSGVGPSIVGNVRTGTAVNAIAPRWAIGNLNGLYGYGAVNVYGVAMGDASGTNVTIDATNGFRIRNGTTDKLKADTSGNLSLTGDLTMSTSGAFRAGATAFGTGTGWWLDYNAGTPRFRVGNPSGNRLSWDGTDLTLVGGILTVDSTGVHLAAASSAGGNYLSGSAFDFSVANGILGTSGIIDSGGKQLYITAANNSGVHTSLILMQANADSTVGGNVSLSITSTGNATSGNTIALAAPGSITMRTSAFTFDPPASLTGTATFTVETRADAHLTQTTGSYLYPGAASGLSAHQTNYYLASHGSYGLYSNTGIALGGPIRQVSAAVVYPGSVSGLVDYQTSYYLASHATYSGLYTNGGFRADGALDSGTGVMGHAGTGGAAANAYSVYWTGTTAQLWIDTTNVGTITLTSDRRVKKNIQPLPPSLAGVMALAPVSFQWDNDNPQESTALQMGLVAQDVAAVFPTLVTKMPNLGNAKAQDGLYRVDYVELVPVLVRAIQELQAEITDLRGRIK